MNRQDTDNSPTRGLFPLGELSERNVKDFGSIPVMRVWNQDHYDVLTYAEFGRRVALIANWLVEEGIKPDDRVAILGENRPEWGMAYLGVQRAGAVAVPVDSLMPPSGIRHILADSGARVLLVSAKMLAQISEIEKVKTLNKIVCFDDNQKEVDHYFGQILQAAKTLNHRFPKRKMDDLAAILYTSGTTGYSKGVMLSQINIVSNLEACSSIFQLDERDVFLSVLPIHHAFECTAGFLLPLYCGSSITYARSLKSADLMADIKESKVTLLIGVPLLFEKMHAGIVRGIEKKGTKTKVLFGTLFTAVTVGEKVGFDLGKALFKSVRDKAGFSTIRHFVSGGGPLNPATGNFFVRLGISMLQGYGLTETSPVTHVNRPEDIRLETVGPPIPGVECKIVGANSQGVGEVCIKGPNVFRGYYNNDKATAEVLDADGWFHTGDLGKIHSGNMLQIMGRMKNMLVTGGGKNVYPEEVEHYLNMSDYIAEALVLGIPRESGYGDEVGALIYPDYEQVDLYFEARKTKATPEDIYNLIKSEINEKQKELSEYKRVRKFGLVDVEFEKTSTRKIKRFLYKWEMLKV